MFNKIKNNLIDYLKDYYKAILFFIVFFMILTYPVPYYVFTSGGITDLSNKFIIENAYIQKGSYNLSYVNQVEGNILSYIGSQIIGGWDAVKIENYQYNSNESLEEMAIRDRLSLTYANQTAVLLAYSKAGKEIKMNDKKSYVYATFDFFESDVKVKIGDVLLKVNGKTIEDLNYIKELINTKSVGDSIEFEFERDGSSYKTNLKIGSYMGEKAIGITFLPIYDFEVNPKILFKFNNTESGPSAGFMTTLAIYDAIIPEDLTNGLKIAGTGTIEPDGRVGEIGGIKYKIAGAEKDGASIFFAPSGNNYEEAMKIKKRKKYKINIIEIKTLDDAIKYLESINNK